MEEYIRKIIRVSAPILVHLGVSFAVVYAGTVICMWQRWDGPDAALMTVLSAVFSAPFLWKMWKRDQALLPEAVERKKCPVWFYAAAFGAGVLASCLGSLLMQASGAASWFSNTVQEELFAGNIWVQFVGLGFITPAVEELIFRGLFYQRLRESIPRGYAIAATALIFALWHQNPIQILYAFPMGLLLQLLYCIENGSAFSHTAKKTSCHWETDPASSERCGSLKAPVLFHIGANLISIAVEYFL